MRGTLIFLLQISIFSGVFLSKIVKFLLFKKNAFKLFSTKPCNICSVLRRQAEHFLITATALLCAAVWPSSSFTTGSLTLLNCWNFTKTDILTLCLLPFFLYQQSCTDSGFLYCAMHCVDIFLHHTFLRSDTPAELPQTREQSELSVGRRANLPNALFELNAILRVCPNNYQLPGCVAAIKLLATKRSRGIMHL